MLRQHVGKKFTPVKHCTPLTKKIPVYNTNPQDLEIKESSKVKKSK